VPRHSDFSSTELVSACAASANELAWAEFIRRFHPTIAAAVLRASRHFGELSRLQVDDLIQDTYLKFCEDNFRLLRSFEPRQEDSIYGFLQVVAANTVNDHFKSVLAVKRGANLTEPFSEPAFVEARMIDESSDMVSQRILLTQIDKILRQVTAGRGQGKKCTIFWLRHLNGFTASEIAAIPAFGLTTQGVESLLLRLTIMIRSHLMGTVPHRKVKVLSRESRFRRTGS
jgi:RNA polymerase sigma-70 factor (ECF subfamily)